MASFVKAIENFFPYLHTQKQILKWTFSKLHNCIEFSQPTLVLALEYVDTAIINYYLTSKWYKLFLSFLKMTIYHTLTRSTFNLSATVLSGVSRSTLASVIPLSSKFLGNALAAVIARAGNHRYGHIKSWRSLASISGLEKKISRLVCCHVPVQHVIPYHGFLRASSQERDSDGHSLGIHSFNRQFEVFPVYHVVVAL